MPMSRTLLHTLSLPYESLRTTYGGNSEVRVYRNEITKGLQVGKRIDTLGLEDAVATREATLLKQIRHPNIVPVSDVAEVSGYPAPMRTIELIMDYYKRGSLFDAFERGERFSVGDARRHAAAALLGLAELHGSHRILHRDVKSPNVFLADDGSVMKVGDLGVAVPMEDDGTAEAYPSAQLFSSPETFVTGRVSARSDIYQMGLILFELANGPLPYADNPLDEIAKRLERGRPGPRPRDLGFGPHVPRRMRTVIRKATSVDPARRYASAREMHDALAAVPLVDWALVVDEPDRRVWEGRAAKRPDRRFRVDAARRRRAGGWRLTGQQYVSRWQRLTGLPDQIAGSLDTTAATGFFDAMVARATKR
jgi:eukaryotic-like serine/threonine-protein kinase